MKRPDIRAVIRRHRLPVGIVAMVGLALLVTTISMSLYISSGTSSLDLSRPGFTKVRSQIDTTPATSFDGTGPMNKQAFDEFTKLYDSQRKALDSLGSFNDEPLSDQSLQLQ